MPRSPGTVPSTTAATVNGPFRSSPSTKSLFFPAVKGQGLAQYRSEVSTNISAFTGFAATTGLIVIERADPKRNDPPTASIQRIAGCPEYRVPTVSSFTPWVNPAVLKTATLRKILSASTTTPCSAKSPSKPVGTPGSNRSNSLPGLPTYACKAATEGAGN